MNRSHSLQVSRATCGPVPGSTIAVVEPQLGQLHWTTFRVMIDLIFLQSWVSSSPYPVGVAIALGLFFWLNLPGEQG
jgi:hypothetical protein